MIPNINEIRASSISIDKVNECKKITETQEHIDSLLKLCKERAEKGYGYLYLEYPRISVDYIYDIKRAFEYAGYKFDEHIEHWWTAPDQVLSIFIEWKKDTFYTRNGL